VKTYSYFLTGDGAIVAAPPISDTVFSRELAANVAVQVTVPAEAKVAYFTGTADFYVREGGSITVPGASENDAPEFNPVARQVTAGQVISLVAPAVCKVSIAFYK
jgi:hypothetical protein